MTPARGIRLSTTSATTPWMGGDPEAWIEHQERQERVAKLRFDRTELNGRANRVAQTPDGYLWVPDVPLAED